MYLCQFQWQTAIKGTTKSYIIKLSEFLHDNALQISSDKINSHIGFQMIHSHK